MNDFVSVVIPTRNEEQNVKKLMFDITVTLVKSHIEHERIVVDDSTDKTAIIAEKYGAKVIRGKGQGLGQAIIDGIEASYFTHNPPLQTPSRITATFYISTADSHVTTLF